MTSIYRLVHEEARRRAADTCQSAPDGWTAKFSPPTRTSEMNAKFHAMCGEIARSGVTWAGKKRTADQWKILLVSGHAVATKEGSEITPGLEGEFINLRESTALMSKKRGSSLIEYTQAWMAANGIESVGPI